MATEPTYTVELPQLDHSDSSPPSFMSTIEQPSPAIPYYSAPVPATTAGTADIYGWHLSPWTPLSFPSYSPNSLGLSFQQTSTTFDPYVYNYLPTAVPTRMPSSSSVPIANCAGPIDIFGASPPCPDLETLYNTMQALTSTGCAGPDSPPDSFGILGDRTGSSGSGSGSLNGRNDLKSRRSPPSHPRPEPVRSMTAPMELAVVGNVSPEVPPRKRSRTPQACKRCRIRRVRCFGGNPCNRCLKRKFDCEFTSSRRRDTNKPRPRDLSLQILNLSSHVAQAQHQAQEHQAQAQQHMHPHAHDHIQHGVSARDVKLARSHTYGHTHSSRPTARRHSVHTANPVSSMMPAVPSVFRPLVMHTTAIPYRETPALGLGLELKPAIEEDADGESEPDIGNPSLAPLSAWISNSSTVSSVGVGSTVSIPPIDTMPNLVCSNMDPGFEIHTLMMEDQMMFTFSPQGVSGNSDADGSYDFPFMPVTSMIPLLAPVLGSQPTSQVNTPPDKNTIAATSQHGDRTSSNASLPRSAMNIDDPMLSEQADHLVNVREVAIRQVYTSDAGDWLAQQPQLLHPPTTPF
ncbi:hypothetical protein JCM24511_07360 [Saitozyma sp. JCM 24511]|nr:hypothetical protein JCM24511_07360 [Saitozyma sp. JCM 24511]